MQPSQLPHAALPPAQFFVTNPHARISFSRLAVFHRCPAWYRFQYVDWHRAWAPAVTRAGHAVQSAFEQLVHEEPPQNAAAEAVLSWARERSKELLIPFWEHARKVHAEDPNSVGEWDLSFDLYAGFVGQAARFHTEEALARLECRHPRSGAVLPLDPVPDLSRAWKAVVPWHVASSEPLADMEHVPGGFFQGQYDLVYDWTGTRRIVDLKASSGGSPFSTEIALQLLAYAYLERALGRGRPEGVEAWFLGRDQPWVRPLPEPSELDAFEQEVVALFERSGYARGFGQFSAEDFPAAPAQLEGHQAAAGDASAWCSLCPAAFTCKKSSKSAPGAAPGRAFDTLNQGALQGPVTVQGVVCGVGFPQQKRGKLTRRFTLANQSGVRSFSWDVEPHVQNLLDQGLRAGRCVRIEGLNPWRHPGSGHVLLYPTQQTQLTVLDEPADS